MVVIVLATALALAACGSGGSHSTSISTAAAIPTVPTNTPQVARARIEAAQCFRAHGINIPDFTAGGGRIRQALRIIASYPAAQVRSVTQACASSIRRAFPNATGANLTPSELAQRRQQGLAFTECMRSHGIAIPDPTAAAGNPGAHLKEIGSLDTSSPTFKAAASACRVQVLKGSGG